MPEITEAAAVIAEAGLSDSPPHVCTPSSCRPAGPGLPEILEPFHARDAAGQLRQIDVALERFHYDTHAGPFRYCYERPCREVAGITRGVLL